MPNQMCLQVYSLVTANMAISDFSFDIYPNVSDEGKLGDVAAKVAIQHFDLRYATLLFFNSTFYYGIEVFLRLYHNNIVVNRGILDATLANKTHQFVLFASDATDVEQLLDVLKEFELDNTGNFIIICESPVSSECDEEDIMELCWIYRIVNIVFIRLEETEAIAFTYFPVADGTCTNLTPIKLDCYHQCKNTTNEDKIFSNKLRNLKLCTLTVSTFMQSPYMNITNGIPNGADGDLLRMIALGLNASLVIMTPSRGDGWGWRQDNGTWMGSLADVDEDLANFSMTSGALTLARFSDFQISASYYSSKVVWVAHPAQLQNAALKLLHPFEPDTRVALVVSFFLVVLYAFLIKTDSWTFICRRIEGIEPTKSIVFYAWMICMGQAVIKLPTRSAFLQMTLIWVWYCFLIRTAYQVYLISSLKGKIYEHQFETIEDVINAKYQFGGGPALKDYYIDYPVVYDNWVSVDTAQIIPTALNISKGMNFVLAMNLDAAKMVIKSNKVSLHILPEIIISSPSVLLYKKYSPLSDPVNLILGWLTASGFPDKMHKVYTSINAVDRTSETEGETLKIVHFTACYFVLILGWILSIVFFSLEIYFGKFYQHPRETL